MNQNQPIAVVLLSGGLDSATCLAWAKEQGFIVHALSFDYGQRHAVELQCAKMQARHQMVEQQIISLDLRAFGGSALTDNLEVPKHAMAEEMGSDIPVTYVPARNTVFLSYALAYAEVRGAYDLVIGVNAMDYSGYPDCRPDYIAAYEAMANLALKATVTGKKKIKIHTPLQHLTKAQIAAEAVRLEVDLAHTSSCYDPVVKGNTILACGQCDSCLLRKKGFNEAGFEDKIIYNN